MSEVKRGRPLLNKVNKSEIGATTNRLIQWKEYMRGWRLKNIDKVRECNRRAAKKYRKKQQVKRTSARLAATIQELRTYE